MLNSRLSIILVCCVVGIIHISIISRYSVNVPFSDDYDAILSFINNYVGADSLKEKAELIVARHNEHRIAVARISAALQYSLLDEINFKGLCIIGNIFLLLLLAAVAFHYRSTQNSWWYFIPVPFIIFNLSSFEAFLWPMVVVQTMGVLLFSFLSVYLMVGRLSWNFGTRFTLGFLLAIFATYSCGNGMLTFVVVFAALLTERVKWIYSTLWAVGAILVITFYMSGYAHTTLEHPSPFVMATQYPDMVLPHFLTLLGDYFFFARPVMLLAGFGILSAVLYWLIPSKSYRKDPVAFYFLCFLLLSCAVTSLSRSYFGTSQAFAHRYHIYSALIVAFVYMNAINIIDVQHRTTKVIINIFIIVPIVIYTHSIYKYNSRSRDFAAALVDGAIRFNEYGSTAGLSYPNTAAAADLLRECSQLRTYSIPYSFEDVLSSRQDLVQPKSTNDIFYDLNLRISENVVVIDSSFAVLPDMKNLEYDIYISFNSEKYNYVYETRATKMERAIKNFVSEAVDGGFQVFINGGEFAEGIYTVGILMTRKGEQHFELTTTTVEKVADSLSVRNGGSQILTSEVALNNSRFSIDSVNYANARLWLRGWAVVMGVPSDQLKVSVLFKSEENNVTIDALPARRPDVAEAFSGPYVESGFVFDGPSQLSSGKYRIVIRLTKDTISRDIEAEKTLYVQ